MSLIYFPTEINKISLKREQVHIWYANLDQPKSSFIKYMMTLSSDEQLRAKRYHFVKDRMRFIFRRGILRSILGSYLRVAPSRLIFRYGNKGKPALAKAFEQSDIFFNLSHSMGIAIYAFTRSHKVGIDIEYIRDIPEMDKISELIFSPKEVDEFGVLAKETRQKAFFRYWTRKEAYSKALGEGLSLFLDKIDVESKPGRSTEPSCINSGLEESSSWSLQELNSQHGYVAALAVDGNELNLKNFRWVDQFVI